MQGYWLSKPSGIDSAAADLRTLSLHVLSRAGFGKSFKFESQEYQQKSTAANYKTSLQTILENCVLILGLGTTFIAQPWLPKKIRDVYAAYVHFRTYMTDIYEEEKAAYVAGRLTESNNLMRSMIRASQAEAKGADGGLTEAEIYGNMFVFNFAGHDTTAHSFTFSIYFLAAHPEVQDWLDEEIQHVFEDRPIEQWDYRADFPRLKRCLAILYETIRLYTPVPVIKWTADEAQALEVSGKTYRLPADCMVAPSYGSVQTDPRFWGSDSLDWNPSRFIVKGDENAGEEEFRVPVRGAFIGCKNRMPPFSSLSIFRPTSLTTLYSILIGSDGARNCPGRKFSQVEFVAAMAVLFRGRRVEPVLMPGESPTRARKRVLDLIENDSGSVLLLQMLHPERAPLVWKEKAVTRS